MCVPPEATLEKPCLRRGKEQLLLRTEAHPHKENRRQAAGCWSECTPSGRQLVHAHLIFHLRPSCIIYSGLPQCGTAPKQRPSWIADTLVFLPQLFKIYWGSKKKKKRTPWAPNSCSPWQRGTQPRVYKYFEIESMKAMVLFLILNFFT